MSGGIALPETSFASHTAARRRATPEDSMKDSFANLVRHAVARHLGIPDDCVDPSHRLREDLGLLPLDLVLVALCLEDVASTRFPVERLDSVGTVEALTGFLWSCRCAAPTR